MAKEEATWSSAEEEEEEFTDEGELSDDELRSRLATGQLHGVMVPKREIRKAIPFDPEGLKGSLAQFEISSKLSWIEKLLVSATLDPELDPHQDLKREDAFYRHTLEAVARGYAKLKAARIPIIRPTDYYAEMVKTDDHMRKIREKLLSEQHSIEASERARAQRQMKKFGKKVQQETLEARQRAKKQVVEEASRQRKETQQRLKQASADDEDFDVETEVDRRPEYAQKGSSGAAAQKQKKGPNKRRLAKNEKYGMGGRKRGKKSNSSESTSDMSSFRPQKNKAPFSFGSKSDKGGAGRGRAGGAGAGAGAKRKPAQRPGKERRKQMRSRK